MSAWLFMFAASRTSDYQFVMQPEVFDTESCDVLRSQLQLDDSDPARLRTVTVPTKQAGDVLCAYRSGPVDVNTADPLTEILESNWLPRQVWIGGHQLPNSGG